MKKQIRIQALYATSLLAISLSTIGAQAALTRLPTQPKAEQAIVEDAITPEPTAPEVQEEEVIVVKKPKTVVRRIVREQTEISPPVQEAAPITNNINTNSQAVAVSTAVAPAPDASRPSAGSQLDNGIKTKMVDVQSQFEQALLKTLDKIKITVDDGSTASAPAAAPTQSIVVQDTLVATQAAPKPVDYMSVEAAPAVKGGEEDLDTDAAAIAAAAVLVKKRENNFKIAPVLGMSVINPAGYNMSARYTLGFELEMDVENSIAVTLGYSYSQYNIALAGANPFMSYYQPYGGFGGNLNVLQYNQNLFEGGMRIYLMPRDSKFRAFIGGGLGYNLGYVNYNQNGTNGYMYNPYYNNINDYQLRSWLGILSTGASFAVSHTVSIGALFKYALVLSSNQNQNLNNYAFVNNFGYGPTYDQAIAGGTLARENFYSILGTVKVAF